MSSSRAHAFVFSRCAISPANFDSTLLNGSDYDEIQASEDGRDACVNPSRLDDPPQLAEPRRVMWASAKSAPRGSAASDAQQVQVLKAELRDVSIRLSAVSRPAAPPAAIGRTPRLLRSSRSFASGVLDLGARVS